MKSLALLLFLSLPAHATTVPTESVSFAQAFEAIVQRDLTLKGASLGVDSAEASRLKSIGAFTPDLAVVVQDKREAEPLVHTRSAALTASVNLFRSGADVAGVRASNRAVDASREDLLAQRQKTELATVQVLTTLLSALRQVEIQKKLVRIQSDLLRVSRERFQRGLLPRQESDRIQIDLENANASLANSETELIAAQSAFTAALGANKTLDLEWPWKKKIASSTELDSLTFDIEKRPDYRSANFSIDSARLSKWQAAGRLLPSVDLTGSYGNFNLDQEGRHDWSTMVRLTIPLFERFQGWSSYRVASINETQGEFNREAVLRNAPAEFVSLKRSFIAARDSALLREKTALMSEDLFSDALKRFQLGRTNVNDLAIEQRRLLESQQLEIQGWAEAHRDLTRLCHALGRFVGPNGECRAEPVSL